ncbi:hypothetical protein [Haliscomenobacter hydrossis]|uniref:hypothetical protein n=1 Tax=Haliscomenobacter hydrossis TaxID=2350 RepID=UPI0011D1D355|nr:hypothetical protein [Haliscomenobacter hydrossis]
MYTRFGLGAVKNIWLITCLISLARTVNLNKLKDYVGGLLKDNQSEASSHYKRLTRFFQFWSKDQDLLDHLMQLNIGLLQRMGFKYLVMDGTSWKIGVTSVHYLVLSVSAGPV